MNSAGEEPSPGPAPQLEWHPSGHNPWLVAVVATLGTFMEVLDTTIVNVALPHMAGNLGADVNDSTWVLTSYLVSNAIVLPLSAWFSSLIGRRNFYMLCMALFTTSSLCCGFAPTLGTLVLFRLFQGMGGGGLQPATQAIMVDAFPPEKRGSSMAVFGMTVVFAPIIGPTLGGWLTDNYSWRWVFFINIPVGILSMLLVPRLISDPPYFRRRRGAHRFRLDYIGLGLLSLGLGTLQIVLDLGERRDWFESTFIRNFAIISAVSLVAVIFWELRHKDPVVNFRLLRERNLGFSCLVMFLFGASLYGSTVLLPLFMQTLLGYTSLSSGLALSPGGIVTLFMMPIIGILVSRTDQRRMIAFGILVITGAIFEMGRMYLQIDFKTVALFRIAQGFGMAFIFVPVNTLAYAYVARETRDSASSLINLARNIGGSMGIAFSTTLITRYSQVHQTHLVSHLTPYDADCVARLDRIAQSFYSRSGDPVGALHQAHAALNFTVLQQARNLAFMDVFHILAFVTLLILPLAFFMRRPPKTTATP